MAVPKKRKAPVFFNNAELGGYTQISFEVFGEDEKGSEVHSFDANVHYYEKGEGKPLILVHGIGQSLYAWRNNIDFFTDSGYRVLALDLPGFGYSTHPNIYYTVEENANIIRAFMESLGIKKASIAAFSTSAISALILAHDHPDTIDKLVLISPGGPNEAYPFLLRSLTTKIGQMLFKLRLTHQTLENLIKELYFNKPLFTKEMADQYYEPYKDKSVRDTLISSMMHFEDPFDRTTLHGIKKDTLVLSGHNDPIHSKKMVSKFTIIPATEHKCLRNCGHFVNEEKPDIFNRTVVDFLNQTEADKIFV